MGDDFHGDGYDDMAHLHGDAAVRAAQQGSGAPAYRNADVTGYGSKGTVKGKDASYMTPDDGYPNSGETYTDEWSPTNFNAGGKRVNRTNKGNKG